MKILIEIETTDVQTLGDARGLIDLYLMALGQKAGETAKAETTETKKPTGKRIRPTKNKEPEPVKDETVKDEPVKDETVKDEPVATDITLADLKIAAKNASSATDRETVLGVIKRYGDKLSEVTENNYQALLNDLTALEK